MFWRNNYSITIAAEKLRVKDGSKEKILVVFHKLVSLGLHSFKNTSRNMSSAKIED